VAKNVIKLFVVVVNGEPVMVSNAKPLQFMLGRLKSMANQMKPLSLCHILRRVL
jgi:hypothetical protein